MFLQELFGLSHPWPFPSAFCCVLICRRGKDSAIATEVLHALVNGDGGDSVAKGLGRGPRIHFLNLHGGLQAMYSRGLSRMPVV